KLVGLAPIGFGEFRAERDLAADPARRKGKNDKMAFDVSGGVARDRFAEADQRQRRNFKSGLLPDFADDRLLQGLAEFDAAARQRIKSMRWRPRPAHNQHPAVAEYRRAHRQIRPRWISPRVIAIAH